MNLFSLELCTFCDSKINVTVFIYGLNGKSCRLLAICSACGDVALNLETLVRNCTHHHVKLNFVLFGV